MEYSKFALSFLALQKLIANNVEIINQQQASHLIVPSIIFLIAFESQLRSVL